MGDHKFDRIKMESGPGSTGSGFGQDTAEEHINLLFDLLPWRR